MNDGITCRLATPAWASSPAYTAKSVVGNVRCSRRGPRRRIAAPAIMSSILTRPADAFACYVFAHGAGAGMHHSFMAAFADGMAQRSIATLRYQFPLHGEGRLEATWTPRPSRTPPCVPPCCWGRRAMPRPAPVRWRQVVWRPHDLASASQGGLARRAWPDLRRLLHPHGQARYRARRASGGGGALPDAFPARHAPTSSPTWP